MPSRSKTQSLATEPMPTEEYASEGEEMMTRSRKRKHYEEEGGVCGMKGKHGKSGGWGYASMYLWFIVAPIVIWIILFTIKPPFVTDNINGVVTINNQKLLLWTLVASVIAWIAIYSIYYCRY